MGGRRSSGMELELEQRWLPRLHRGLSWGRVPGPGVRRTECPEAELWPPLGQRPGSPRHWPLQGVVIYGLRS